MTVEYATWGGIPTREADVFESLAAGSGFSLRDCHVAARTGRLAGIVAVYEQRGGRRQLGGIPGSLALAIVRAKEHGL
jgi:hypothetical protein